MLLQLLHLRSHVCLRHPPPASFLEHVEEASQENVLATTARPARSVLPIDSEVVRCAVVRGRSAIASARRLNFDGIPTDR